MGLRGTVRRSDNISGNRGVLPIYWRQAENGAGE